MILSLLLACAAPPPEVAAGMDISLVGAWRSGNGQTRVPRPSTSPGPLVISRVIELPPGWDDDTRAILRARGLGWRVTAAIDGAPVASDAGGIRPLALDLTGALRAGAQTLTLTIEGASPTNILPGRTVPGLTAWTYDEPRGGGVRAAGELWLEVGGDRRIDDLDVRLHDGVLTATAEVSGADGEAVTMTVVRDGEELGRFPSAVVEEGRAEATLAWDGPLWRLGGSDAPFLQYLVARLPSGETRQVRFGAREVRWEGATLLVNGEPTYLAVERVMPTGADDRRDVAGAAATLARSGLNGMEIHASLHGDAALDAADELGLFVVMTPMCDGRFRAAPDFAPDATWSAFMAEGNRRIASAARKHPSLTLWNLEAEPLPEWPETYAAFARTDVPWVDMPRSAGFSDESFVRGLPGTPPLFYNELPWRLDRIHGLTIPERLGRLLSAHRGAGIGMVVPNLTTGLSVEQARSAEAERYTSAVRELFTTAEVPAFALGDRRGPATVVVEVRSGGRPAVGKVVTMRVPGQAVMGAFTDERGVAELTVDYRGDVRVGVLGEEEEMAVTTRLGRYSGGAWTPGYARAELELAP